MVLDSFKVKVYMAEREMSTATLANKIGLTYGMASHLLKNGTEKIETIGKIAHALDVPVIEIVEKVEA